MLANSTLGGFNNTRLSGARLGFFFDDSFLGEPPPPAPRLNPSLPMPGPISYDLPGSFLPPILTFPVSTVPTITPIRNTSSSVPSYPGAPTTLDRVAGIVANVVGAFATNRNFQPTGGAYGDYARTQQTGIAANAALQQQAAYEEQAAANAAVVAGSQGAGADAGSHVGSAVGNIGDQLFGIVTRHPFATLLVGVGAALWILPSPKRGR